MSDRTRTITVEEETVQMPTIREPVEANLPAVVPNQGVGEAEAPRSAGRPGIKIAELGRRPKIVALDETEDSRTVAQLIQQGSLKSGMEYFVNGVRSDNSSIVVPGDAVVAVPRIRGG